MNRLLRANRSLLLSLRCFHSPKDVAFEKGASYYIIPEIPNEAYLNKVFQLGKLPKQCYFSGNYCFRLGDVAPQDAFHGFSRLLINHQLELSKLSENLKQGKTKPAEFLAELEEILYPVEHAFHSLRTISTYTTDPIWILIIGRLYQKLKTTRRDYLCLDPVIYRALTSTVDENNSIHERGNLTTVRMQQ